MKDKSLKKVNKKPVARYFILGFTLLLSLTFMVVVRWARDQFVVDLGGILFTLSTQLKGTDGGVISNAAAACLPLIFHLFLPYLVLVLIDCITKVNISLKGTIFKKGINIDFVRLCRTLVAAVCIASLPISIAYALYKYDAINYFISKSQPSTLYEDYYVDPETVNIICPTGESKNLIFIYLESMETAYADQANGGTLSENLIPNLTELAYENTSFSGSDKLGGFSPYDGTTWTLGSIFATYSGVPFSFPVQRNAMSDYETFAAGIYTMGDFLASKGYTQEFLCGSDASYAGRDKFFIQHGNFDIFDYHTAIEKGYISEDYFVWWGFEDKYLYEIAKDELTRLASSEQPFNLTMLTVDTHFTDGYYCELCDSSYDDLAANVVSCADRQISEFIDWCKQQDFYANTVIVMVGDHPRMDTALVSGVNYWDRTMYNCFINSAKTPAENALTNRQFSAMDIMPTTLSALGFEFERGRLGLGVDLFSGEPTLAESIGSDELNREILHQSDYYLENFS